MFVRAAAHYSLSAAVRRFRWNARRRSGWSWIISLYAGNSLQVLVDRADLVVRQVFEIRPWHDLEKVTIDGGHGRWVLRKAVCGNRRRAVWMKVVKILAGPHDRQKFFKG